MLASFLPSPFFVSAPIVDLPTLSPASRPEIGRRKIVRRRANMQQGKGLEVLGHAIEYLVDSRLFLVGEPRPMVEAAAIRILSRCSRELFASCVPVVPVSVRLLQWASGRLQVHERETVTVATESPVSTVSLTL